MELEGLTGSKFWVQRYEKLSWRWTQRGLRPPEWTFWRSWFTKLGKALGCCVEKADRSFSLSKKPKDDWLSGRPNIEDIGRLDGRLCIADR